MKVILKTHFYCDYFKNRFSLINGVDHSAGKTIEFSVAKYGLQILGGILFIIGAYLLLQQGFLTPLMRVALGFITATGLVAGGTYFQARFWSIGAIVTGLILYYISLGAGYNWYDLISLDFTLAGSIVITTGALWVAERYHSQLATLVGLVGGFVMVTNLLMKRQVDRAFFSLDTLWLYLAVGFLFYVMVVIYWRVFKEGWYWLGYLTYCFMALFLLGLFLNGPTALEILIAFVLFVVISNRLPILYSLRYEENTSLLAFMSITTLASFWWLYDSVKLLLPALLRNEPECSLVHNMLTFIYSTDYNALVILSFAFGLFLLSAVLIVSLIRRRWGNLQTALTALTYGFFVGPLVLAATNAQPGFVVLNALVILLVTFSLIRRFFAAGWLFLLLIPYHFLITAPVFDDSSFFLLITFGATGLAAIFSLGTFFTLYRSKDERVATVAELCYMGMALAPLYLYAALFKTGLIRPYETLIAAAYGIAVLSVGLLRSRKSLFPIGWGAIGLSLLYAGYYYLPFNQDAPMLVIELLQGKVLSLAEFSMLFGGLSLFFILGYVALYLIKNRMHESLPFQ